MKGTAADVKQEPDELEGSPYESIGRVDQKRRTRGAIKTAAAALVAGGTHPTMADVADAAGVSRSSAYRYFPSAEALFAEVALDAEVAPSIASIDAVAALGGPAGQRLAAVIQADHEVVAHHETSFRAAIRSMLSAEPAHDRLPRRPGNRLRYLAAAVAPLERRLPADDFDRLVAALALLVGLESRLVLCDIVGLDDARAAEVKQWAAAALLRAAVQAENDEEPPDRGPFE